MFSLRTSCVCLLVSVSLACGPDDTSQQNNQPDATPDLSPDVSQDTTPGDTTPPTLIVTSPPMAPVSGMYRLVGSVSDDVALAELTCQLGDEAALSIPFDDQGAFDVALTLTEPTTTVIVRATDAAGNTSEQTLEIERAQELTPAFTIEGLNLGSPTRFDASSSVDPNGRTLSYTFEIPGFPDVQNQAAAVLFKTPGTYMVTLTARAGEDSKSITKAVEIAAPAPQGTATLTTRVLDIDGAPIAGAQVRETLTSKTLGTTDAFGVLETSVDRGVLRTLVVDAPGYAQGISRVEIPASAQTFPHRIMLIRRGAKQLLPSAQDGGEIRMPDGATVEFRAGSIVDASGAPATGLVVVQLTPIDARKQDGGAFPGVFDAYTPTGELGILGSYGPTEVHLTNVDGERLQIDPAMGAAIEMPLFIGGVSVGDEVPIWSLDETFGIWVGEGAGQVVTSPGSPTGFALRANVSHFSWWNPDIMIGDQGGRDLSVTSSGGAGSMSGPPVLVRARSNGAYEAFFDLAGSDLLSGFDATVAQGNSPTVTVGPGSLDVDATTPDGRYRYDGPIEIRADNDDPITLNLYDIWEEAQPFVHLLTQDVETTIDFTPEYRTHYVRYSCVEGEFIKIAVQGRGPGVLSMIQGDLAGTLRPWRTSLNGAAIQRCPSTGKHSAYIRLYAGTGLGQATVLYSKPGVQDELAVGSVATVVGGPSSVHQRLVYMGRDQKVLATATIQGNTQANVSFSMERDEVEPGNRDAKYGPNTGVFASRRAGWHLLEMILPANHPIGQAVDINVTLLREPEVLDLAAGATGPSNAPLSAGTLRSSIFWVEEDEGFAALVTGESGERPRIRINTPDGTPALIINPQDFAQDRGVKFKTTQTGMYTMDVYATQADTEPYEVVLERATLDPNVTPKIGECEGATHRLLSSLEPLVGAGQVLTLCPGSHTTIGAFTGAIGVELVGEGRDQTTLQGLSGTAALSSSHQLTRLEGLTLRAFGTTRFPVPALAILTLRDLRMLPVDGMHTMGLEVQGDRMRPGSVVIEGLEMLQEGGVTLRYLDAASLSALNISSADAVALRILDPITTLSITDSTLISVDEMTIAQIDGVATVANTTLANQLPGIVLRTRVEDSGSLTFDQNKLQGFGRLGLLVTLVGSDAALNLTSNQFVPGSGSYQNALMLELVAASGAPAGARVGKVTMTNNIFSGFTREIVRMLGSVGLNSLLLAHNLFYTEGSSIVSLREPSGSTVQPWVIANNIFMAATSATWGVATTALTSTNYTIGGNLFFNITNPYSTPITHPADLYDTDPMLMNFQPMLGSPVINGGATLMDLPNRDISGMMRPMSGAPDIGPYEQ